MRQLIRNRLRSSQRLSPTPAWPQATSSRISSHCPERSCPRNAAIRHTPRARRDVLGKHCSRHGSGSIGRSGCAGIPMRRNGTRTGGVRPPRICRKPSMGQNRLAIVGIAALTCAPVVSGSRVHVSVIGGAGGGDRFTFAWPIWKMPASLAAIRALLSHPKLRESQALQYLGVDHLRVTRRVSLDRLRNFRSAEPIEEK